jgi:phosphatidate cytidylyltransferase
VKQRIITGLVAGILFITVLVIGGPLFSAIIGILAIIALVELLKMKTIEHRLFPYIIGIITVSIIVTPDYVFQNVQDVDAVKYKIFIIAMLLLLVHTVITKNKFTFEDAAFVLLSSIYVGIGFYYINVTREIDNGLILIIFILLLIWASDSGAYFVGKFMGKRKLWPVISPNKTIEGSIGGIILAIIVAIIFQAITPVVDSVIYAIFIGLVAAVFGQMGDLVQSAFKRIYNVKDSGNLLPGHGGILDRFDSWLFVFSILHILNLLS